MVETGELAQEVQRWRGLDLFHYLCLFRARHARNIVHTRDFVNVSPVVAQRLTLLEPRQANVALKRSLVRVDSLVVA